MATTRGRSVKVNQTVVDQADFFQADGYTRVVSLTTSDITAIVFFNNTLLPWPVVDGSAVSDSQVKSGILYFNEILTAPGYFSVRYRPNSSGFWRIIINYVAGQQILAQDFDVVAEVTAQGSGMTSSFIRC
jgi:hypothetical protein